MVKWAKDIKKPKIKIICKLKFWIFKPCRVANIFQIDIKKIKKKSRYEWKYNCIFSSHLPSFLKV